MINKEEFQDEIGDNHVSLSAKNPVRDDAFAISDDEKIEKIKKDVESILLTLGMDLTDDSLKGTPNRVAKMFVKEIFGGLNPEKKPKASTFDNNYKYGEMLVEKKGKRQSLIQPRMPVIIGSLQGAGNANAASGTLSAPFITNYRKSSCSLYFKRKSYWFIKNEPNC